MSAIHSHSHNHHNHSHNHSAANKAHYDSTAHDYDNIPMAKERSERVAEAVRKACAFDEKTTVMEFACGTGLVSKQLAPFCKHIVGVDISQGMVDQYNKRTENQNMKAMCAELKGEPGELDDEKFDVIVCSSAYHHFTSIDDVTRMLTYFLKPGGALLVIDIIKDGYRNPNHAIPADSHYVPHTHGFDESHLRKAFESADLSFSFDAEALRQGDDGRDGREHDSDLFIAKGIKLVEKM